MNKSIWAIEKALLLGAFFCALLLAMGFLVLVSTSWGHQIDNDAFLGRGAVNHRVVKFDSDVLDHVSDAALLVSAVVVIVFACVRRCTLVGVVAVVGFGSAVLGAEVLKRKLPWRVLVPDDRLLSLMFGGATYPSGHATIGTSLALSLVLVSPARWRPWIAIAAGGMSSTFATAVLFAGWHRPSDALGALAWSGFCMTVAAAAAVRFRGRPRPASSNPGPAVVGSVGLGILVAAVTWISAAKSASQFPHGDLPFFALTALIIAGAFSLITWYGWQLRAVDWPDDRAYGLKSKLSSTSRLPPLSRTTTPGSE
ncbi:MAG: phosphatase PAP2 family protein [Verrucomicrobia bacterium]|nr:phosphatase PAP2 family protein [Verrucomicrobiota bacterium]